MTNIDALLSKAILYDSAHRATQVGTGHLDLILIQRVAPKDGAMKKTTPLCEYRAII